MRRLAAAAVGLAAVAALWLPLAAQGAFGLHDFDVTFTNQDGTPAIQAGSHPFEATVRFKANTRLDANSEPVPDEDVKDLFSSQIVGLVGSPEATPRCANDEFLTVLPGKPVNCPDSSAVGTVAVETPNPNTYLRSAVYNLEPPPGVAAKLGFIVFNGIPVTIEASIDPEPPHNIVTTLSNTAQISPIYGSVFKLWGNPADPAHDPYRGQCWQGSLEGETGESCPTNAPDKPFLTLPRACAGPLATTYRAISWQTRALDEGFSLTHDDAEPPAPRGMGGCVKLDFSPRIESQPTSSSAETGTGLDFDLHIEDQGITSPGGLAQSDVKKAVVTLPPGMTINPSVGEGLAVCTPAELARESASSLPGAGCPNASKVGSLLVQTPLIEDAIEGSIYLAQQDDPATSTPGAENPFDTLIALYFVLKHTELGVSVKLPVKVEPDPGTGRLLVTLDNSPQFPISHFNAHLRTGARAALVTPSACGTYTTKAVFTPWANPSQPVTSTASFSVDSGIGGGPCPPAGVPPFHPAFEAGSINNNAGSFSPFNMRLIREDGEQDMTKFSATLPPGELGSLNGVSKCPDSAIAIARAKQGREEIAAPTCPANSLIGHTLAGAGVGSALTYVKGYVYLAGPYNGDPLSVIAVTPAVAGPFDAGTVVVRLALTLNPKTAEVEVDGANSDPIPHILKGIVLKVRDLRVYVDRPNFTLNPTSCEESSARGTLFSSFLDVLDPADDKPFGLSTRFQAANCMNLGFKPKLALNLKGGTKRGGHPGLTATYTPKPGDANIKGLVVRLPRSAFLDQAHIKTICTRVQFAAKACPKASQYGYIRAWTPLLDEPLQGPVYLRSSNHKLPDLVFDLHGLVNIEVAVRIDSQKGGIRATLEDSPDAPLSRVVLQMQGAKKGLIINSRNLCGHVSRANLQFSGHNGKQLTAKPPMKPECGGKRKGKRQR